MPVIIAQVAPEGKHGQLAPAPAFYYSEDQEADMSPASDSGSLKKTIGAVFAVLFALVLLAARSGLFTGFPAGGPPNAAEECERAVPWQEVWDNPEKYRGKTVTVTGKVAGTAFVPEVDGRPTFLNLGSPHPQTPRFEVIIWGRHREKFLSAAPLPPEQRYARRRICAAGTIALHEGIPQIEARDPQQVHIIAPSEE
jgi:hypothetical protein